MFNDKNNNYVDNNGNQGSIWVIINILFFEGEAGRFSVVSH